MVHRHSRPRVLLAVGVALICVAAVPVSGAPALVVIISIDMLPADVLERCAPHFGPDGFKRLMTEGAWFTDATYAHAVTLTGPGHATIATGSNPRTHGIVANAWYKDSPRGIGCVSDRRMTVVGVEIPDGAFMPGASPRRLMAPTIGDALKKKCGKTAKVWSFAEKDRAAILMGGANADGVIWWHRFSGNFVSSGRYFPSLSLPPWCEELNRRRFADSFFDKTWQRALPVADYAPCDDDDVPYEMGERMQWSNTLPKKMGVGLSGPDRGYYNRLRTSPFGNDLTLELARRAVIHEGLGADSVPDLLCVGLSAMDACGHVFGPDSHEFLDMMVQTDRQLADWLRFLDDKVGAGRWILALTGDHGGCSVPEYAQKQGRDAGRVRGQPLFEALDAALRLKYGAPGDEVRYVAKVDLPWAYLQLSSLKKKNVDINEAAAVMASAAKAFEGIETAIVTASLHNRPVDSMTPLERAVRLSVYPGRSGHVFVEMKPNWYETTAAAGHGTFHRYDTHVPLIFFGKPFKKGRFGDGVHLRDLAPTLAKALDMPPPGSATGVALDAAIYRPAAK